MKMKALMSRRLLSFWNPHIVLVTYAYIAVQILCVNFIWRSIQLKMHPRRLKHTHRLIYEDLKRENCWKRRNASALARTPFNFTHNRTDAHTRIHTHVVVKRLTLDRRKWRPREKNGGAHFVSSRCCWDGECFFVSYSSEIKPKQHALRVRRARDWAKADENDQRRSAEIGCLPSARLRRWRRMDAVPPHTQSHPWGFCAQDLLVGGGRAVALSVRPKLLGPDDYISCEMMRVSQPPPPPLTQSPTLDDKYLSQILAHSRRGTVRRGC